MKQTSTLTRRLAEAQETASRNRSFRRVSIKSFILFLLRPTDDTATSLMLTDAGPRIIRRLDAAKEQGGI